MSKDKNPALQPAAHDNPGAEARIALAVTIVWVLACGLYLMFAPNARTSITASPIGFVFLTIAICFPLVLVWAISYVVGSIRSIQSEALALRTSMDRIKTVLETRPEQADTYVRKIEQQLSEISALSLQTDERVTALATKAMAVTGGVSAARADTAALSVPVVESKDADQSDLPLQTPVGPDRVPISVVEFIKALNFPDNAEDREGFRVLRRAFEERQLGKLLRASQDVLTLLSQDGIYMDDLNPDKPLPQVWRKFAHGERGLSIAALGGIRDRSALTLAKTRLKNDSIFRDATHHFLRQFDLILVEFEQAAEDGELLEMSETRSARAFMLLGRVAGSFD